MTQRVSSWVPIFVKPSTLIENISSQLDGVRSVQTFEFFFWEEVQPILTNWGIVYNGVMILSL